MCVVDVEVDVGRNMRVLYVGGRVFVWRVSVRRRSVWFGWLTSGAELPRSWVRSAHVGRDACETLHLTVGYLCSLHSRDSLVILLSEVDYDLILTSSWLSYELDMRATLRRVAILRAVSRL